MAGRASSTSGPPGAGGSSGRARRWAGTAWAACSQAARWPEPALPPTAGAGAGPWHQGLGLEPFQARDPATRAVVETVGRTREALGLDPLPEPGLQAVVAGPTPPGAPATAALVGPGSATLAREALAHPRTEVDFATGVSRALSDPEVLGPPPPSGPERLVWARTAAAALASERGLAGPVDLEPRRELGLTAWQEGSGELTRWAWDHELSRLGPWPTEAVRALAAENSALRAGLVGMGQAPQDPKRYLEDVGVEETRLSSNLAWARSGRAQAEESLGTYGPLGRRWHREEVDRGRDALAGWRARETEIEAALS
ncbi:MAG: hypothetical protein ACRD0J_00995, partial [Acidimicrobiales bacterium]